MPGNSQTADQVKPTVQKIGCVGPDPGCTFFDTSAFAPVTDVRFGNVGRNTMRAPGVVNTDMSLFRTFKLTEKFNLQFRAEAFNLSNTPHFNGPDSDVSSSDFGKITSTDDGYGTSAGGRSREFRFGLRLNFYYRITEHPGAGVKTCAHFFAAPLIMQVQTVVGSPPAFADKVEAGIQPCRN